MDGKLVFGVLSLILSGMAYAPYIRAMLKRQIRPHLLSWIVWSLISLIAYLAQQSGDAGAGSWAVGFSTLCCSFIAVCSFWYGERRVTRFDWLCFLCALAAIPLWRLSSNPLMSLLLVMGIDTFAYGMTFRKTWIHPHSETVGIYLIDTIKYVFAILAMGHYSLLTVLFPLYIIAAEGTVAAMILFRRRAAAATA